MLAAPSDSPLAPYKLSSNQISIQMEKYRISLNASPEFYWEWNELQPDDFIKALKLFNAGLLKAPTTTRDLRLLTPQVTVLKEYFTSVFAKALVTQTMITVVPK